MRPDKKFEKASRGPVNYRIKRSYQDDAEFYKSEFWLNLSERCKIRDKYKCRKCKKKARDKASKRKLHAHHRIPRSRGGPDNLRNLITLCDDCHSKEHDHMDMSHRLVQDNSNPKYKRKLPCHLQSKISPRKKWSSTATRYSPARPMSRTPYRKKY